MKAVVPFLPGNLKLQSPWGEIAKGPAIKKFMPLVVIIAMSNVWNIYKEKLDNNQTLTKEA